MRFLFFFLLLISGNFAAAADVEERAFRDVVYARPKGDALKLDLYVPQTTKPPPVIVWFHGGGWKYGDKRYRLLIRDLTREGFAVATVEYRLSSRAKWPAQRDDCLAALHWLRSQQSTLGIDANRMGLAGDSAGGHLAALLGLMEGTPRIGAVFAIYPPTDLVVLADQHGNQPTSLLTELFGGTVAEKLREAFEAGPVNFVDAKDPPFLFLHGDRDDVVPLNQSEILRDKLRDAGIAADLIVVKGRGHAFTLDRQQLSAAAAFFRRYL